jgi:hypothetical protein
MSRSFFSLDPSATVARYRSPDDAAPRALQVVWILWPAFMVAAAAELVFFALVDPSELHLTGITSLDAPAIYAIGFFFFWLVGAASGALAVALQRSPFRVKPCPPGANCNVGPPSTD